MATANRIAPQDPPVYIVGKGRKARYVFTEDPDYPDNTAGRIRAYLMSLQADPDSVMFPAFAKTYHRGRAVIEALALNAEDDDAPALELSPGQCADVLAFMGYATPVDHAAWWADKGAISHVCGYVAVLGAMEASLRGTGRRS